MTISLDRPPDRMKMDRLSNAPRNLMKTWPTLVSDKEVKIMKKRTIGVLLCIFLVSLVTAGCIDGAYEPSPYRGMSDNELIAQWNQLSAKIDIFSESGRPFTPRESELVQKRNRVLAEMIRRGLDVHASTKSGSPIPVQRETNETPTTTSPQYRSAVRFIVVDENDEPIENLKVSLTGPYVSDTEYEMDWKKLTDWQGECIFGDLPRDGDYRITVYEPSGDITHILYVSEKFRVDGSFTFRLCLK